MPTPAPGPAECCAASSERRRDLASPGCCPSWCRGAPTRATRRAPGGVVSTPVQRLAAAGWKMPPAPTAKGLYVPARRHGDLLYLSAHGPFGPDGGFTHRGTVGEALSVAEGQAAAAACALSLLASTARALGDLSSVSGALAMTGFVNAAAGFEDHAKVLDGASEVLDAAFGPEARPARSVVGVASLPFGLPIVVEATVVIGADDG
ncbi:MAG: RidA family protein [Acidimicrobiia bacterium]|nr:RidA family protein [Acidimicrobiia bacterium]MYB24571.1 RidA family protein [Acidimicrobiia bacterium]MYJ14808.1 RidA family protein [Acidimicrobiia bacterium]